MNRLTIFPGGDVIKHETTEMSRVEKGMTLQKAKSLLVPVLGWQFSPQLPQFGSVSRSLTKCFR